MNIIQPLDHLLPERFETPAILKKLALASRKLAELFGRERSVITRHISNIFKEGELDKKSNVHNLHIANSDKPVKFYNLDIIISVGYRHVLPKGE